MPFDDHLVEVRSVGGIELLEAQVVQDQHVDTDQLPHLGVVAGVQPGCLEPLVQFVGPLEVDAHLAPASDVAERRSEESLPDADRDPDRLQQLRALLPCEVRVTSPTHPLSGQLLEAHTFQRRNGVLMLVVTLPDGSRGTIPADSTGIFGDKPREVTPTVLSAEGIRQLHGLVLMFGGRPRKRARPQTRK